MFSPGGPRGVLTMLSLAAGDDHLGGLPFLQSITRLKQHRNTNESLSGVEMTWNNEKKCCNSLSTNHMNHFLL